MAQTKLAPPKIVDLFLDTRLAHGVLPAESGIMPRSFDIIDAQPHDTVWLTPDADYRRLVRIEDYPKLFGIDVNHKLYTDLKFYIILIEQLERWQNAVGTVLTQGIRKDRKYPTMLRQFLQAKGYAMARMLAFLYDYHKAFTDYNNISMLWLRVDGQPMCAFSMMEVIDVRGRPSEVKKRSEKRQLPPRAAKSPANKKRVRYNKFL